MTEDERDAARYRWLRGNLTTELKLRRGYSDLAEAVDEAVDAAMAHTHGWRPWDAGEAGGGFDYERCACGEVRKKELA
jgi:hypothetical protein